MRLTRILATSAGAVLLVLVLFGTAPAGNQTLKVGIFAGGYIGNWQKKGYQLAFSTLKNGSFSIQPVYVGCADNPYWVRKTVKRLSRGKVVAFIGGSSSKCTSFLAGVSQRHKIPLISPFSPMELLSRFGFEYVFRLNAPIRWYIDTLLNYAVNRSHRPETIGFIYEASPFGRRFTDFAEDRARSLKLKVIANENVDFADKGRKAADKVIKVKPEVLMIVGNQEDGLRILRWLKEANYKPKVLLGAGAGFSMPSFLKAQQGAAEGLVTVTQWYPSVPWPQAKGFVDAFKKRYETEPNYLSAEAYAATQVLFDAMKRANCTGGFLVCRESLKKALIDTNMETVFGPVNFADFRGYTNQNPHKLLIMQVKEGKLQIVSPPDTTSN